MRHVSEDKVRLWTRGCLAITVIGYTLLVSLVCYLKYRTFTYIDFDLTVHAQGVWNLLHGNLDSSILGISFLGNHSVFILFLIAPLYAVFQSPLTLLFLQTVVLASGAVALFLMAERPVGPIFGLCLSVSYLLNPALVYMNLFEFHPVALATGFLLWAAYCWQERRWRGFSLWLFLSLLCQENVALVCIPLGMYSLFFRESRRVGVVVIGVSLAWFSFLVFWFLPLMNPGRIEYLSLYKHLGRSLPEIVWYLLSHPLEVIGQMGARWHWDYYLHLLVPLGFLPLGGIDVLWMGGLILLENLLSARPIEQAIHHHYTALLTPFLFWATVVAGRRLVSHRSRQISIVLGLLVVISAAVSNALFGVPRRIPSRGPELIQRTSLQQVREEWVRRIPKEASVIACFPFLSHLTNRRYLYSFHHVYLGTYTLGSQPYQISGDVQYALLDFDDWLTFRLFKREGSQERMEAFFTEKGLQPSLWVETLAFYERHPPSPSYELLADRGGEESMATFGPLELIHVTPKHQEGRAGKPLVFEFHWRLRKTRTQKEYKILYGYRDKKGTLLHHKMRPFCAGRYPTTRWKRGQRAVERHALLLPDSLAPGEYTLFIGLHDPLDQTSSPELAVSSFSVK